LSSNYPKNKLEIIVNVNGSSDNTAKICKKYKRVKTIVTGPKNCRAEALNEIIPNAKGEIIGIFDADTIVEKNCLSNAIKRFSDKTVMGVSGMTRSLRENIISKTISIEKSFNSLFEYIINIKLGHNAIFAGKNMYIRKKIFGKIGKLDVFVYSDDIEFSQRMKKNKYKVVYEPSAVSWEQEPSTLKIYYKQRNRWARSGLKIFKFHNSEKKRWISDLSHFSGYYFAPFISIVSGLMLLFFLFNFPVIAILYFFIFFLFFSAILITYSRLMYNEPLTDLIYLPLWFVLQNINLVLLFKVYIDEKLEKKFIWHDIERK